MSVTPLALAPCTAPARARRVGAVPTPRVRPLAEVLPPARATVPVDPDDGARTRRAQDELDRLAAALRPVALRLLTAVADVLAGRRPPGDLGPLLGPDALATLVRATRQARGSATRGRRARARDPPPGRVCAACACAPSDRGRWRSSPSCTAPSACGPSPRAWSARATARPTRATGARWRCGPGEAGSYPGVRGGAPWHCLYLRPEPQGQGALRDGVSARRACCGLARAALPPASAAACRDAWPSSSGPM